MRPTSKPTCFALLSLLSACEGVGRPLVDQTPGERQADILADMCPGPPDCTPPAAKEPHVKSVPLERVDLETCQAPVDAVTALTAVSCAELFWPEIATTELVRTGPLLENSNLTITSDKPLLVSFEAAQLSNVWISLQGPVTLRISAQSSVSKLRILLENEPSEARVELTDTEISNLTIGSTAGKPSGSVALTRTRLARAKLAAQEIDLASVTATELELDASSLRAIDLDDTDGLLSFDDGMIAASSLLSTRILGCGQASLVDTSVEAAVLSACTRGPLRAYDSALLDSFVSGAIESDKSMWSSVRFGAETATELVAWDSLFGSVQFCSHSDSLRFAGLSSIACSKCEGRSATATTCELDSKVELAGNRCPALETRQSCKEAFPLRARPNSSN